MGFVLFLLVFLSLYSGLHLYALLKVRAALTLGTGMYVGILIFMIIMVLCPIIVRVLERLGLESMARLMAHVGYIWMGFLFLFISAALILDISRLLVLVGGLVFKTPFSGMAAPFRYSFWGALIISAFTSVYGYFAALDIQTTCLTLKSPKIPLQVGRLRIAQISDVHLGLIVGEKRLRRILAKVKVAEPDIVVSTGDLVDGQPDNISGLARIFHNSRAKYGAFAVTGNHEYYAGLGRSLDFMRKAGFRVLRGEGVTVAGMINIVGVDDPTQSRFGLKGSLSEKALLSGFPQDKFTLFLKHRPSVDAEAIPFFDLQLSGHVHKGQIFPFSLVTKLVHPRDAGLYDVARNAYLYVSRGAGTWGPPMRFLASPEVVIIDLVHES